MVFITDPQKFSFCFDWPADFDYNLKYKIEFIIKSHESLAEKIIKLSDVSYSVWNIQDYI